MSEQRSESTHHIPSVGIWLRRGWQDFSQTPWISMGFSSLFLVISLWAYWQLLEQDLGLILYPFITGFMVVAPLLVTGFQRVGRLLHEGQNRGLWILSPG